MIGGDAPIVRGLLIGLRERGHEIEIVSRVNVMDFWRGRVPARFLISEAITVRNRMRRFSPDAWLVYLPCTKHPDLFGWWQHPKRYVLMGPGTSRGARVPGHWRWLFRRIHQRSLAAADKVVAYYPKSADELRALGVTDRRLRVLPPPAELWDNIPDREEARRRLGLSQERPIILCVSRLAAPRDDGEPYKTDAVLDLLGTLARLPPDVLLLVVGDGPGRQLVEDKAAKLQSEGRVRLAGSVGHEDVRLYYAACDLFAYPCVVDRPWVSVMEAQACGRPVVTMRNRSAELTVQHGQTGLLAADLEEFHAHLALLIRDRQLCESLGQAGQEYVARFHTMKMRVQQIEQLLSGRD
jgi:glycosyltransferase involved in cell wall biosynthesis